MFYLNMLDYPLYVLPLTLHLDLGYLPDTQGFLELLSELCTQYPDLQNCDSSEAKIPFPFFGFGTGLDFGYGLELGLRLVNLNIVVICESFKSRFVSQRAY